MGTLLVQSTLLVQVAALPLALPSRNWKGPPAPLLQIKRTADHATAELERAHFRVFLLVPFSKLMDIDCIIMIYLPIYYIPYGDINYV